MKKKILIKEIKRGYEAYFKEAPYVRGHGRIFESAIGNLIMSHRDVLGFEIEAV